MNIDYTFEEIAVTLDGKDYLATGTISVDFYEEVDDRSVGFVGGAVLKDFGLVDAELTDENGDVVITVKAKSGPTVDVIINALDHDSIAMACDDWLSGDC